DEVPDAEPAEVLDDQHADAAGPDYPDGDAPHPVVARVAEDQRLSGVLRRGGEAAVVVTVETVGEDVHGGPDDGRGVDRVPAVVGEPDVAGQGVPGEHQPADGCTAEGEQGGVAAFVRGQVEAGEPDVVGPTVVVDC